MHKELIFQVFEVLPNQVVVHLELIISVACPYMHPFPFSGGPQIL